MLTYFVAARMRDRVAGLTKAIIGAKKDACKRKLQEVSIERNCIGNKGFV